MPPDVFAAQYMNDPGTEQDKALTTHEHFSFYTVRDSDDSYIGAPLRSEANLITWSPHVDTGEAVKVERPFGQTISRMYRLLCADPIRKPSSTSDQACAMVIGIERTRHFQDVWWLLDIRLGRPKAVTFLDWIWELGKLWQPRIVAVESIGFQKILGDATIQMYAERPSPNDWQPRVFPVNYRRDFSGDLGKGSRIGSLSWRFENNKIKLPKHLILKPGWRELFFQINNFTPDLNLLPFDDAVDTLAMANFVPRPRGGRLPADAAPLTLDELLAKGEQFIPGTRVPILQAVNMDELSPEAVAGLDLLRSKRHQAEERKRGSGRKPRGNRFHGKGVTRYANPV
jgi:hypothetical protein